MKRIAKVTIALAALLAVSACAQPNARSEVFENYNYNPSYNTAYAPAGTELFRMNNYY